MVDFLNVKFNKKKIADLIFNYLNNCYKNKNKKIDLKIILRKKEILLSLIDLEFNYLYIPLLEFDNNCNNIFNNLINNWITYFNISFIIYYKNLKKIYEKFIKNIGFTKYDFFNKLIKKYHKSKNINTTLLIIYEYIKKNTLLNNAENNFVKSHKQVKSEPEITRDIKHDIKHDIQQDSYQDNKHDIKQDIQHDIKHDIKQDIQDNFEDIKKLNKKYITKIIDGLSFELFFKILTIKELHTPEIIRIPIIPSISDDYKYSLQLCNCSINIYENTENIITEDDQTENNYNELELFKKTTEYINKNFLSQNNKLDIEPILKIFDNSDADMFETLEIKNESDFIKYKENIIIIHNFVKNIYKLLFEQFKVIQYNNVINELADIINNHIKNITNKYNNNLIDSLNIFDKYNKIDEVYDKIINEFKKYMERYKFKNTIYDQFQKKKINKNDNISFRFDKYQENIPKDSQEFIFSELSKNKNKNYRDFIFKNNYDDFNNVQFIINFYLNEYIKYIKHNILFIILPKLDPKENEDINYMDKLTPEQQHQEKIKIGKHLIERIKANKNEKKIESTINTKLIIGDSTLNQKQKSVPTHLHLQNILIGPTNPKKPKKLLQTLKFNPEIDVIIYKKYLKYKQKYLLLNN